MPSFREDNRLAVTFAVFDIVVSDQGVTLPILGERLDDVFGKVAVRVDPLQKLALVKIRYEVGRNPLEARPCEDSVGKKGTCSRLMNDPLREQLFEPTYFPRVAIGGRCSQAK